VKVKSGRKLVVRHDDAPIGEKTVLNEPMRFRRPSCSFVLSWGFKDCEIPSKTFRSKTSASVSSAIAGYALAKKNAFRRRAATAGASC
jgi:hypothetical protein